MEGATRQAGDTNNGGGDGADRPNRQRSRRGAGRRPKGRGNDTGRGPKGLGEATERRGQRGRQVTDLTLT